MIARHRFVAPVLLLAACGGPTPRPVPAAVALPVALPEALPNTLTCLGFTPTGDAALFATTRSDSLEAPPTETVTVEFATLPGAKAPLNLEDLGLTFERAGDEGAAAQAAAAWRAARGPLAERLAPMGLLPCPAPQPGEPGPWTFQAGPTSAQVVSVTLEWTSTPPKDEMSSADRTGTLTVSPQGFPPTVVAELSICGQDGCDHEQISALYSSPAGVAHPTMAVVIGNADTGHFEDSVLLVDLTHPKAAAP